MDLNKIATRNNVTMSVTSLLTFFIVLALFLRRSRGA